MTRSTRTPADVPDHIGEAKTALKAILRSIHTLQEDGLDPQGSAPGYDRRGLFGSERTPSRTGAPSLGDARHPLEADGDFEVGGEVIHQGDTSGSVRGRWQRAMRHLADATLALCEGTDAEDGAGGALMGAAVIADVGDPHRPNAPRRRAPHLLPTVDWRDAQRMVHGLALMLGEIERGGCDLKPPEVHAVLGACDEIRRAKDDLPGWTRQKRRRKRAPKCACGKACEWRKDRRVYRDTCQTCRKAAAA